MNNSFLNIGYIAMPLTCFGFTPAASELPYKNNKPPRGEMVDDLLSRMSIKEKINQLLNNYDRLNLIQAQYSNT